MQHPSYEELSVEIKNLKKLLSDKKKIAESLKNRDNLFTEAYNYSPVPMTISKLKDGTFLDVNQMFTKMFGYTREESIGKTSVELKWIKSNSRKHLLQILKTEGRIVDFEIELYPKKGRSVSCLYNGEVITVNNCQFLFSVVLDISARIQEELMLKEINKELLKTKEKTEESEKKFKAIFENSIDAIGISKNDINVMCNQALLNIFGFKDQSEFIGESVFNQFSSKEHKKIIRYIQSKNNGEKVPNSYETVGIRKNGDEFPMEINTGTYNLNNEKYTINIVRDITERKLAEELFRESSFRYETLLTKTSDGIMTMTPDGKIIEVNDSFAQMHGYSVEEILNMNIADMNPPGTTQLIAEKISYVLTGEPSRFEIKHFHKDGHLLTFDVSTSRIIIGDKKYIIAFHRNITERKKTEEALILSEDKFRKAFITNPDAININRFEDGMYISINKGFTQIMEYTEEDVIGKTSLELNIWDNPEDRKKLKYGLETFGTIENLEAKFCSKSGKIIDGLMSASIIELEGVKHILNITRDISNRKQAELLLKEKSHEIEAQNEEYQQINEELNQTNKELIKTKEKVEESEETYRILFESISDAVFISELSEDNNSRKFIKVNDIACQQLGYTSEELLTKSPYDISSEKMKPYFDLFTKKLIEKKNLITETEHVTKDGRIIPVEISAKITPFKNKTIIHSIARDITERKLAEESLTKSQERFKILSSIASEGLMIHENGTILDANLALAKLAGYSNPEELIGKDRFEVVHLTPASIKTILDHVNENSDEVFDVEIINKEGTIIPVETKGTNIIYDGHHARLVFIRDITARKKMDEEL